ncbi:hypothetical protein MKX57_15325 [Lysinibacillus sp. FSL M8-0216]|uniref:hypothetical protein n=3 Tax=Bacillaceae TaxID=186817 RepID=UPI00315A5227
MGLLGLAGSLLGMIPKVGSPSGKKKGKSGGSKGKSSKKSSKKKSSTKKKQKKSSKKKKKKKRKKKKKKWGKFFTKARKLKNSLSKSKLVKRAKKAIKKAILTTKKVVKKAKAAVTKAKQQVKAAVKQTKQVVKEKVLPVVKKAAQATTKAVKNAVKPKNLLNTLQVGLDLVGLIPGVGEIADGVNGIIYLARGDKVNAALSFGAMIPFVGWAATGGKFVKKGAGVVKSVTEGVQKALKGPVGSVVDKVKKQVVNVKTQIQSKVAEVKQQLRQMVQSQQDEFSFAGINIEDTGTVGRNTPTPSPKPSNNSNKNNSIKKEINSLDQQITDLKKAGNIDEIKKLQRERNKLANKLDTPDDLSKNFNLTEAKDYERKIDNTKYFSHEKGDFGEEVSKIVAKKNELGEDISEIFQVGRNGIDGTFLSKGPPPKLTMIESKASDSAIFSYSEKQKLGGKEYFEGMLNSNDSRYSDFKKQFKKLKKENPGLELDFIRVETDIKITKKGFGVEELKIKDWNKQLD